MGTGQAEAEEYDQIGVCNYLEMSVEKEDDAEDEEAQHDLDTFIAKDERDWVG